MVLPSARAALLSDLLLAERKPARFAFSWPECAASSVNADSCSSSALELVYKQKKMNGFISLCSTKEEVQQHRATRLRDNPTVTCRKLSYLDI